MRAVMDEPGVPSWVPDLVYPLSIANIKSSVGDWGPDGGWMEGPNYAGYANRYMVAATMSLLTATGEDPGLLSLPGVNLTPHFMLHNMAPTYPDREYFYWADTHVIPETISQYLGIARHFNDSIAAHGIRQLINSIPVAANTTETVAMQYPVALIYFTDIGSESEFTSNTTGMPLLHRFEHQHLVYARSSWNSTDVNCTYIAFKGSNVSWAWAHNHLDGSTFVYATHGQYFAQDLGNDNYALPQYFSGNRFQLYRTSTIGHNTLSFDGQNQRCEITGKYSTNCSLSPLIVYNVSDSQSAAEAASGIDAQGAMTVDAFAIVNLTDAYAYLGIANAQRGFIVSQGRTQLITVDEAAVSKSGSLAVKELWWSMHTVANISMSTDGLTATLATWNVSVPVTVTVIGGSGNTDCPGALFTIVPVNLTAPQYPTPGVSRLSLTAPVETCNRLVVAVGVEPVTDFVVNPLASWNQNGPLLPSLPAHHALPASVPLTSAFS